MLIVMGCFFIRVTIQKLLADERDRSELLDFEKTAI